MALLLTITITKKYFSVMCFYNFFYEVPTKQDIFACFKKQTYKN